MGAQDFTHWSSGKSAQEAFDSAVEEAKFEYGRSGYTGTIAEKDSFVMIPWQEDSSKTEEDVEDIANQLINDNDPRINDKWGPAGCLEFKKQPTVREE